MKTGPDQWDERHWSVAHRVSKSVDIPDTDKALHKRIMRFCKAESGGHDKDSGAWWFGGAVLEPHWKDGQLHLLAFSSGEDGFQSLHHLIEQIAAHLGDAAAMTRWKRLKHRKL